MCQIKKFWTGLIRDLLRWLAATQTSKCSPTKMSLQKLCNSAVIQTLKLSISSHRPSSFRIIKTKFASQPFKKSIQMQHLLPNPKQAPKETLLPCLKSLENYLISQQAKRSSFNATSINLCSSMTLSLTYAFTSQLQASTLFKPLSTMRALLVSVR